MNATTASTHVLFDSARSTKALRSFGIGLVPVTRWTGSYGWMPSKDDAKFAVQMFAMDQSEPTDSDYDRMAAERDIEEAEYAFPVASTTCGLCGHQSDFLSVNGLCPVCELMADEQGQGSMYLAAMGRRATY